MTTNHVITVRTRPKYSIKRVGVAIGAQVFVIGLGVAAGSAAMQWCGFIFLCLLFIALAMRDAKRTEGVSIAEARALLDEIEKNEKV